MPRFDFLNGDEEITIDSFLMGFANENMDNFNNDDDFKNFILYFGLGEFLSGELDNQYTQYAKMGGITKLGMLDQYDIRGKELYKLYKLSNKDKMKFIELCHHIGSLGSFRRTFSKEEIFLNLSLENPVSFLDENVTLPNGQKPIFGFKGGIISGYNCSYEEEEEFSYELHRSFVRRLNNSIKANKEPFPLLEEKISYKEMLAAEEAENTRESVDDDYQIDISNLFFGKEEYDASGGVINLNITTSSWFEKTNIQIMNYDAFRSIPKNDYFLVDGNGKIFIPKQPISKDEKSFLPTSPVREVQMASVPTILTTAVNYLEEDYFNNESTILTVKGLLEILEENKSIAVADLQKYESLVRGMYEMCYGPIFQDELGPKK